MPTLDGIGWATVGTEGEGPKIDRGGRTARRAMPARRINSDKPHLWKADVAASVDRFNGWFIRFAPEAFRATRLTTTGRVKAALVATRDLRSLDALTLKASPDALSTLRMCTAPPLAVDRLVGLAGVGRGLVGRLEKADCRRG